METNTPPAKPQAERHTWLSLLWGTVIWYLHLNLAYGLASLDCKWGWFGFRLLGLPGIVWVELLLTLLAVPLMAYLVYLPWRDWRQYQSERPPANPRLLAETEADRRPMVAFITMLLNGLYFLFAIGAFVPILALNPCT